MSASRPDLSAYFKLAQPKRPPCKIAWIREQLDNQEQLNLDAACGTDAGLINSGAIRDRLAAFGHDVSIVAVANHRRGICRCGKEQT